MEKNLFFFDHKFAESTHEAMSSKFNVQEAEIIVRFAWYMVQQNYKPT